MINQTQGSKLLLQKSKKPSLTARLLQQVEDGTHISQNLELMKKYGIWKHGLSRTRAYSVWRGMMHRCYIPSNIEFDNYGGRGIKVCKKWKEIIQFKKWFDKNYINGYTLDRINNNGNYEPNNCKFSSSKEQSRNKRNIKYSLEKANEIKELYRKTGNQREVSRITGIDFRYINLIINGKRWG